MYRMNDRQLILIKKKTREEELKHSRQRRQKKAIKTIKTHRNLFYQRKIESDNEKNKFCCVFVLER